MEKILIVIVTACLLAATAAIVKENSATELTPLVEQAQSDFVPYVKAAYTLDKIEADICEIRAMVDEESKKANL